MAGTTPLNKKKMSKNFQFLIIFLLTLLLDHALHAAPLKTLSLDFTRELTEKGKTEHTTGTLHYDAAAEAGCRSSPRTDFADNAGEG